MTQEQTEIHNYIKNYEILIKRTNLDNQEFPLGTQGFGFEQASKLAVQLIGKSIQEKFIVFMYDHNKTIVGYSEINKGFTDKVMVDLHSCLRTALISGAHTLCLCHNHPTGELVFSEQDMKLTLAFIRAAKMLSVYVADHILVNDEDGVSLRDKIGEEKWQVAQEML